MQERTQPGGRPVHTPTSPGEAELKGRGLDDDEANATKGRGNPLLRDSQPTRSHLSCSLIPGGWSAEGSGLSSGKVWGHRPGPAPWGVCAWELHLQPPSCGRRRTSRGPGAVTLVVLGTTSPDTPPLHASTVQIWMGRHLLPRRTWWTRRGARPRPGGFCLCSLRSPGLLQEKSDDAGDGEVPSRQRAALPSSVLAERLWAQRQPDRPHK